MATTLDEKRLTVDKATEKLLAYEALVDIPIREMILRARKAGITREEIKHALLHSEEKANAEFGA